MYDRSEQTDRFHESAEKEFDALPEIVKDRARHQLNRLSQGQRPTDWKPLSGIGAGLIEIRIRRGGAFRLICAVSFSEAIYVLIVFEKKSRKMPKRVKELARRRYREIVNERSGRGNDEGTT